MRLHLPSLPALLGRPRRERARRFFAWLPRRTLGGTWVWLEPVDRVRTYCGRPVEQGDG
jgi:hypothetical protein